MAHTINFSKTGTTIYPHTGVSRVTNYVPNSPQLSVTEVLDAYADGGDITNVTRRNVTEAIELLLRPTGANNMSEVEAFIQSLEFLFFEVAQYQKDKGGAQWFLNFTPHDTSGTWRSEILAGSVQIPPESMRKWAIGDAAMILLNVIRRYYWEGAESELEIANPASPTPATGGKAIRNQLDPGSSYYNYVHILASDISTKIPAPCRIEITSTYTSGRQYDYYIGQAVFSDVDAIPTVLEAEDMTSIQGSPTTPTGTNYSGGSAKSWSNVAWDTWPIYIGYWVLTTAQLVAMAGRRYKLIAMFPHLDINGLFFRLQVRMHFASPALSITDIHITGERFLDQNNEDIADLGSVILPPWLPNDSNYHSISLAMNTYDPDDSGTKSFTFDALYLMPADYFRVLDCYGYGIEENERVADDGMSGNVWVDGWSDDTDGRMGYYTGIGAPFMIWPGRDQRFHFLSQSHVLATNTIRIYYRPRRLTV